MGAERFSAKQYGVRYGRKLREKVGKIEHLRRTSGSCPYCHYDMVKRIAAGIWHCSKCNSKFTGRAYNVGRKLEGVENVKEQEEKEFVEREKEEEAEEEGPAAV